MDTKTSVVRLENSIRDAAAQSLITNLSPDVRVPPVKALTAYPATVLTSLQYAGFPGSTFHTAVMWQTPVNPRVDRYEVWVKNSATVSPPRLVGEYKDSPAVLSFAEPVAGTMVIYVITIMKDGKRNNLNSCPSTTCAVTV